MNWQNYEEGLMSVFNSLSSNELSCIFQHVEPKDRLSVLLTCRRWNEIAISTVWTPWGKGGLGLLHACLNGHVDYYRKWCKVAGQKRWDPLKICVELVKKKGGTVVSMSEKYSKC